MSEERPSDRDEARHRAESALKQAQLDLRMKGLDSNVYLHSNRDGSVDAEIFVKSARKKYLLDLFSETRESLPIEMSGFWISTGARFEAVRDEDNYARHKSGLVQAQTYYQKYTAAKSPLNMLVGQKKVAEKIEKRQRRKVDGIFVRLHWNPTDSKPGRMVRPEENMPRREDRRTKKPKRRKKKKP